ncbi:MAG: hypothetical protein M9895_00030 [Aquamicrobium sp.]|uniref:hypothetical protein n=1 Tax=Aquamicrobium sp. TaxID=1872579 RepID=UPI00349E7955|nr:hypothetical protein [Aquamicrobium sp.]
MRNEILRSIFERLQEHERRIGGHEWRGKLKEVDPSKQIMRMVLGKDDDGGDVLSPWLPYKQTAGAMKFHNPPSVGQVMVVRSESGDIEQGLAEPYRWNDENTSPSEDGSTHKMTFGDVTITLVEDSLTIQVGGVTHIISSQGISTTGGRIEHDDRNIGSSHRHEDVIPGPSLTGIPAP